MNLPKESVDAIDKAAMSGRTISPDTVVKLIADLRLATASADEQLVLGQRLQRENDRMAQEAKGATERYLELRTLLQEKDKALFVTQRAVAQVLEGLAGFEAKFGATAAALEALAEAPPSANGLDPHAEIPARPAQPIDLDNDVTGLLLEVLRAPVRQCEFGVEPAGGWPAWAMRVRELLGDG